MDPCGCDEYAAVFDRQRAEGDRERYHQKGPDTTTRMLLDMVRPYGIVGASLLDIGGGIGVIDQELLRAGAGHAVLVDASSASLDVARQEARQANLLERMELVEGDFVRRASDIDAADIVTLHRVVCCYPDPDGLVSASAARARRVYALVLPRDRWVIRVGLGIINLRHRIRGEAFRAHAHPNRRIDELVAASGLRLASEAWTFVWRVAVYER